MASLGAQVGKLHVPDDGLTYKIAWSPDGSLLASTHAIQKKRKKNWLVSEKYLEGAVSIWDVSRGALKMTYQEHKNECTFVGWSSDGKYIASGGNGNEVKIWHTETREAKILYTNDNGATTKTIAWSPDGKIIATADYHPYEDRIPVHLWQVETGKLLYDYKEHKEYIEDIKWSPDGKWLAACDSDGLVQIWDAATGQTHLTYKGHGEELMHHSINWSPDGTKMLSISDADLRIWDTSNAKILLTHTPRNVDNIWGAAWSPDGTTIASAEDGLIQIWSARSGERIFAYQGHSDISKQTIISDLAWSPYGTEIASVDILGNILIWVAS